MIMTPAQITAMFSEAGIYTDPDHHEYIEEKKLKDGLESPYLAFDIDPVHFYADGVVYATRHRVEARLYTDRKICEEVRKIREILQGRGIKYTEENEVEDSRMIWMTTFTMEV